MSLDARALAERVSSELGLPFIGKEGRDKDSGRWFELQPADHPAGQTFSIKTTVGWRRLEVTFKPGNFAGELLGEMGHADPDGRAVFRAVLDLCVTDGAEIEMRVNGERQLYVTPSIWESDWRTMALTLRRGMLAINDGNEDEDSRLIELWTSRAATAILALLPLEPAHEDDVVPELQGLPEGARTKVEVNRYERDRRNRAAALTIHGYACKACQLKMDERYGDAAAGLIEVHHVTPVSELGAGYIIDPRHDLVPLCPNCHSVVHRRSPPYSVDELRAMLGRRPSASRA